MEWAFFRTLVFIFVYRRIRTVLLTLHILSVLYYFSNNLNFNVRLLRRYCYAE